MKIALGCDSNALNLKEAIKDFLNLRQIALKDFGIFNLSDQTIYPDIAVKVAESILSGECERGILLCGTGIGMAISANKVPGIYAAVCHDPYSAERSRRSNNAQIMTMGSQIIGEELAKKLVDIWLKCDFDGGRSLPKVVRICEYEKQFSR